MSKIVFDKSHEKPVIELDSNDLLQVVHLCWHAKIDPITTIEHIVNKGLDCCYFGEDFISFDSSET